jgi:hypothetical protein
MDPDPNSEAASGSRGRIESRYRRIRIRIHNASQGGNIFAKTWGDIRY